MFQLSRSFRLSLAILLALVLGMASVARASHEAHAPSRLILTGQGERLAGPNCVPHGVDEDGRPVRLIHIHSCGDCLSALDVLAAPLPPMTVALVLDAPRRLLEGAIPPPMPLGTIRRAAHAPRAPPVAA